MTLYLFQALNGLGLGMIYFLIAAGLSIVFGLLHFVNFAHGAFYMAAAYACFALINAKISFWICLFLVPVMAGLAALVLEYTLIRRAYRLPHMYQILLTLGLALVIQELCIVVWGTEGLNVATPSAFSGVVRAGDFAYPTYRLFVIAFTGVLTAALWLALERTRLGALLRAGSESIDMVALLGFNVKRLFAAAFALGAGLAAIAGVLAAPLRGVEPFLAQEALGIAFVIVIIGGMGSYSGALLAALLIGLTQSVMSGLWPPGANLMIFAAAAAIIVMRPNGLLGRA